jgi:hypothetical protein
MPMTACPFVSECIFYAQQANLPDLVAQSFQIRFCKGCSTKCARWKIACEHGMSMVPEDLFPNENERVSIIVKMIETNQRYSCAS